MQRMHLGLSPTVPRQLLTKHLEAVSVENHPEPRGERRGVGEELLPEEAVVLVRMAVEVYIPENEVSNTLNRILA